MIDIFPKAERAEIEEIIGIRRTNAKPPCDQPLQTFSEILPVQDYVPFQCFPKWYNHNTISDYEKTLFTSLDYISLRNAIVNLHSKSKSQLTIRMCGLLTSHPEFLKVFDFLEDNNIINYEVDLKCELLNIKNELISSLTQHHKADLNYNVPNPSTHNSIPNYNEKFDYRIHKKIRFKYLKRERLENTTCACGNRADNFSSDMFFVCTRCIHNGNYPSKYNVKNFHKITKELLSCLWTKKEEYILLRNIERYGDDWKMVSSGLNKTIPQCIFHFIKLPLLDEIDLFPLLPFSTAPNQLSSFVSFVCTVIHPSISAEVAKQAIKYINKPNLMEILMSVAVSKARDVLEIEKSKKERLEKVQIEALIKRISLKIDAIREMFTETAMVRVELEDARERLIDELTRKY